MQKAKTFRAWMGVVDDRPDFYRANEYYSGVLHGDIFKSRAAAKQCYEDVRRVTITVDEKPKKARRA